MSDMNAIIAQMESVWQERRINKATTLEAVTQSMMVPAIELSVAAELTGEVAGMVNTAVVMLETGFGLTREQIYTYFVWSAAMREMGRLAATFAQAEQMDTLAAQEAEASAEDGDGAQESGIEPGE